MSHNPHARPSHKARTDDVDPIHLVSEAIAKLKFGGIQLTVHEGKLVQIEVTEKHRFA